MNYKKTKEHKHIKATIIQENTINDNTETNEHTWKVSAANNFKHKFKERKETSHQSTDIKQQRK